MPYVDQLDPELFKMVQERTWGYYSARCRMLVCGQAGDPLPETWLTEQRAQRLVEMGVPLNDIIRKSRIALRSVQSE